MAHEFHATSGPLTDVSGTITAGGTAQPLTGATSYRRYTFIQNNSAENLYICFTAAATIAGAGCILIAPGAAYESNASFVSNQAISIIGGTTGQQFVALVG